MAKYSSKWLDGRRLIAESKKQGLPVRHGKGDHDVITDVRTGKSMPCPTRILGKGLAMKIIKFITEAGVVLAVLLLLAYGFMPSLVTELVYKFCQSCYNF